MPSISIILPVYNGARYLEQSLNSIREQQYDLNDIEIIATDDNSSDSSPLILAEATRDLPLTVIPGAGTGNWVASTNRALSRASGNFICFLHQDDRFKRDKIRKLLSAAKLYPDVDVFAHPVDFINSSGRRIGKWKFPARPRLYTPPQWFCPLLVQNNLAVPGVMFRRSLLRQTGMLDESLRYTADWDYWLKLATRHDLVLLSACLAEYRIHNEAQTVHFADKQVEYAENLYRVLSRHIGTLNTYNDKNNSKYRIMAKLGVRTNIWLASRITDKPQPVSSLLRAFRTAGLRRGLDYLHLSRVGSRVLSRLKAKIHS